MKAFLALLGVNFKSLLLTSINLGAGSKKRAVSGVSSMLLLAIIMLFLSSTYSFMYASQLAPVGGLDVMLMMMLCMGVVYPIMLTLFAGQGILFSTKDANLVLSLPVSSFAVMLSRLLALYLQALLMIELMLLPAGIAYVVYGGSVASLFVLLLLGVFLALLPTLACLLFGTLISVLISRTRFKNLFNIIFSFVFFVAIFIAAMGVSQGSTTIANDVGSLRASLMGFAPLGWAVQAITQFNLLSLLLLALVCVVPFLGAAWLFSLFFKSLLTSLSSFALKQNYKLRSVQGGSPIGALLKKEAGKFFGTPAFVLNYGLGVILSIGLSIFAIVKKNSINQMMASMLEMSEGSLSLQMLPPLLLLAIVFMLSTICISTVSISLEGKTLWILKEAPLDTGSIFMAKAGFNFIISGGSTLITSLLLGYAFSLPVPDVICMVVIGLLVSAYSAANGLYINLLHPRMDAENDTIVIKQSFSVILNMLVTWAIMLVGAGIYYLVAVMAGLGFLGFSAIMALILAGLLVWVIALLNTKGRRIFANLS